MSLWNLTGAELAQEISQPAPVTVLRGGHTSGIAGVLGQIAALEAGEREELLRAIAAALKPDMKRLPGQSFRNAEEFFAAFNAAREAAHAVAGREWYLDPSVSLKARVPAAWIALRGEMGTYRSPRDVNFPAARFWPGGVLPSGPECAEHGPVAKAAVRRLRLARPAFDLDYTPEEIAA